MLPIGPGCPPPTTDRLQHVFQCPQICIKGLSPKKNRIRGLPAPRPRWPPGPGFLGVARGRAAWHAQLALPVAPATHQPATGDTQGPRQCKPPAGRGGGFGGGAAPAPIHAAGFVGVEREGAAWHAQLALPVAPVTHQPAPGDTQGNVSRQLVGAVVLGTELRQRPHAACGALLQFDWLRKTRGALAFGRGARRPGLDG
jgi:hypothetical protein